MKASDDKASFALHALGSGRIYAIIVTIVIGTFIAIAIIGKLCLACRA
jgi:hypothetical protein